LDADNERHDDQGERREAEKLLDHDYAFLGKVSLRLVVGAGANARCQAAAMMY
jgi:hypothetical protein